ncbi:MAG: hypothetical protein ACK4E8_11550 [Lacibacter sp.]
MKQYTQGWKWYLPGLILGAAAGYTYYHFWGCNGTCLITSSPVNSMLYGAVMGTLFNSLFKPSRPLTGKNNKGEE